MEIIIKLCIITYSYLFNKLFALVFFGNISKFFQSIQASTSGIIRDFMRVVIPSQLCFIKFQASTVEWPSFGSMQFRGSHALLKVPVIKMDLLNPISWFGK